MQPEDPAQLGGKIYDMMSMALSTKWLTPAAEVQQSIDQTHQPETLEAEVVVDPVEAQVVDPVEAGGQK